MSIFLVHSSSTAPYINSLRLIDHSFEKFKRLCRFVWREFLQLVCGENAFNYSYKFHSESLQQRINNREITFFEKVCSWPLEAKSVYLNLASAFTHGQDSSWLVFRNILVPVFFGVFVVVGGLESQGIHIRIQT